MENIKGIKQDSQHLEAADLTADAPNIYQRKLTLCDEKITILTIVTAESKYAAYIPGGYSPSRCISLKGKPMMYAILLLAGSAILFFGYDAGIMALVNTNPDYLTHMGVDNGTSSDAAAIGGLVSLWFGGFGIGMCSWRILID